MPLRSREITQVRRRSLGADDTQGSLVFDPKRFGARGNASNDDTAAIQACVNEAIAAGGKVIASPGNYYVFDTIDMQNVNGLVFEGAGSRIGGVGANNSGTTFTWRGTDNSIPMFLLDDVGYSTFQHFSIAASPSLQLFAGVQSINGSGSVTTNTRNRFTNIYISGTTTGVTHGFLWGGGGSDANNDVHTLVGCAVVSFATAGYTIAASQVKQIQFYGCSFQGFTLGGLYGVNVSDSAIGGMGGNGGSFRWDGGIGGGCATADFYIGNTGDTCVITGGGYEASPRFLLQAGLTSSPQPLIIDGVRYAHAGNIAGDGQWVRVLGPGPVTVRNCLVQDSSPWNDLRVLVSGSSTTPASLTMENNRIETTGSDVYTISGTGWGNVTAFGNIVSNRSTSVIGEAPTRLDASTSFPGQTTTAAGSAGPAWSIKASGGGRTSISTTGTGGAGSALTIEAGPGATAPSAATASTGGAGGALTIKAGTGAAAAVASSTNLGGVGGALTVAGGTGGSASGGASNTGADGGDMVVASGAKGTGATANGVAGKLRLRMDGTAGNDVRVIGDMDTMTYAATISLNIYAGSFHKTTTVHATGNATINASAGGYKDQELRIFIENDATSGKVITFGTNFRSTGTLTGTASKGASILFYSDGTNFVEFSRQTGL